jgi:hypothetical protein
LPQNYHTAPELFERTRCWLVRRALSALLTAFWLVTRALPAGHPARIYIAGRVIELREGLLPAVIPSSLPTQAELARRTRIWATAAVTFAATIIGDLSSRIPVDLYGLPDRHIGIGRLLGLDEDALSDTPHIFSVVLPYSQDGRIAGTLVGALLVLLYANRPRQLATG